MLIYGSRILTAGTLILWHGGNLDNPQDSAANNKGGMRWEYGPGLYCTTHYDTARKYSKGSRKLYKITLASGTDAKDFIVPFPEAEKFVQENCIGRTRQDMLREIGRWKDKGLRAAWFINAVKHYNALPASKSGLFRQWLVSQGVDYEIVDNAYGWNERMVVIFNMQKVLKIERVNPKDEIKEFDLEKEFKED